MGCQLVSLFLVCLISLSLVGFIYIFSWNHHRSSKEAVTLRAIGILSSTCISLLFLLITGYIDLEVLIPELSLSPYRLFDRLFIPIGLTLLLFLGPIIDGYQEGKLLVFDSEERLSPFYIFLRNYLIGPIFEEYVYRFLLSTILMKCFSQSSTILISSTLFSLSHAHHHIKGLWNHGEMLEWVNFICHLVQTFIFASYACCIYLRAQSVFAVILIHSFCNWMGAPRFDRLFNKRHLAIATVSGLASCIILLSIYVSS